jgi:hypothetical protein
MQTFPRLCNKFFSYVVMAYFLPRGATVVGSGSSSWSGALNSQAMLQKQVKKEKDIESNLGKVLKILPELHSGKKDASDYVDVTLGKTIAILGEHDFLVLDSSIRFLTVNIKDEDVGSYKINIEAIF